MILHSRHTVDVSRVHSESTSTGKPRQTITVSRNPIVSKSHFQPLPSIHEVSFCEGMGEISGGVYEDNNLSEVYMGENPYP